MAIFHEHGQIIGKSNGRNALAAAAYRSASKLVEYVLDPETGITAERIWDYTKKGGLVFSRIFAPHDAPNWVYDREALWNKVTSREERIKKGQLAREFDIALPVELTLEANIELVTELVQECFVKHGMIADVNMHMDNPENPHVHVMLTMRDLVKYDDGRVEFGLKNRSWNSKFFLKSVRSKTEEIINKHLELHGFDARVSHLSHRDRGIELEPEIHVGPAGKYIKDSDRKRINTEIIKANANKIIENPELIIDKLSISKPVFTEEEIALELNKELFKTMEVNGRKIKDLAGIELEGLNQEIATEFMIAYSKVLHSDKLTLIVEEDLKGRRLYGLTKRVELERRYEEIVRQLNDLSNHCLNITEAQLEEQSLSEKVVTKAKEIGKKIEEISGLELNIKEKQELSQKQKKAILEILNGKDLVVLEGLPGAGKTTVMKEIVRQYKKHGMRVIGAAPSSSAALNLASIAEIEARNTAQWRKIWQEEKGRKFELALRADYYKEEQYQHYYNNTHKQNESQHKNRYNQRKRSSLTSKDILIIDEASMVELANMDYLLNEAKAGGAKVILVGDNNQFAAIGMQGALKKAASIADVSILTEVRRQKNPEHAKATTLLGEYKITEALEIYNKEDCFSIHKDERAAKNALVRDYIESYLKKAELFDKDDIVQDKSIVICAYTNEAVNYLNKQVREKLKQAGIIQGKGEEITLGSRILEIARGEQIIFEENSSKLDVLNGEVGTVLRVKRVESKGEDNVKGDSEQGIGKDRFLIKVKVCKSDGKNKTVEIDTSEYGSINYGYAVTGYKVQGATVDEALLYYEPIIGYEAFNVMMTRHREKVKLYASQEILEKAAYGKFNKVSEGSERSKVNKVIERDKEKEKILDKEPQGQEHEHPLWFRGLIRGVSRRSNTSFAIDYSEMGLEKLKEKDKVLKEYIDSHSLVIGYLRQINELKQQRQQQKKKDQGKQEEKVGKAANDNINITTNLFEKEKELWQRVIEYKNKRDNAAEVITEAYEEYKERIIQLNLNYENIRKHAGKTQYSHRIIEEESLNTIAVNENYGKLIQFCTNLEFENDGKNKNEDEDKLRDKNQAKTTEVSKEQGLREEPNINTLEQEKGKNFTEAYKKLQDYISESKLELANYNKRIKDLNEERYSLEDGILHLEEYRNKLMPQYLQRIYEDDPGEILRRWETLMQTKGIEEALNKIKDSPKILGNLRGIGLGTWLSLSVNRLNAIINVEELPNRLRKYEESDVAIKAAKKLLITRSYQKKEQELIELKVNLELKIPNKLEKEFIKEVGKVIRHQEIEGINVNYIDLEKFANKEKVQEAILEYYNVIGNMEQEITAEEKIYGNKTKGEDNIKDKTNDKATAKINQFEIPNNTPKYISLRSEGRKRYNKDSSNEIKKFRDRFKKEEFGLSFEQVRNILTNSDYERIFRQYAQSINLNGVVRQQGRRISCGSLNMSLDSGLWNRFSTNQSGDIFHFVSEATGLGKREALEIVAERAGISRSNNVNINNNSLVNNEYEIIKDNISSKENKENEKNKGKEKENIKQTLDEWLGHKIVPEEAPKFEVEKHLVYMLKNNEVSRIYEYKNSDDKLIGYGIRLIDQISGKKQVLPVSYCYNEALGKEGWRLKGFSDNYGLKPIYGLEKLNLDRKVILIVEGEKTADRAQELLPEYSVMAWLGGSGAASHVNWDILKGREVVIWPDNDKPGVKAAELIAKKLRNIDNNLGIIAVVNLKEWGLPDKWDLADELPKGKSLQDVKEVIKNTYVKVQGVEYTKQVNDFLIENFKASSNLLERTISSDNMNELAIEEKILWQMRSVGMALDEETVKDIKEENKLWQAKLSSSEALYYEKYAEVRGGSLNEHEFLNLKNPLYLDSLGTIACNSNTKEELKEIEIPQLINNLEETYNAKLQKISSSLRMNERCNYFAESLFYEEKKELYWILVRDLALLHSEQMKLERLPERYIEALSAEVYGIMRSYNPTSKNSNSNKLELDDKAKVALELYKITNTKDWWIELTEKTIEVRNQISFERYQLSIDAVIDKVDLKVLENNKVSFKDLKDRTYEHAYIRWQSVNGCMIPNDIEIKAIIGRSLYEISRIKHVEEELIKGWSHKYDTPMNLTYKLTIEQKSDLIVKAKGHELEKIALAHPEQYLNLIEFENKIEEKAWKNLGKSNEAIEKSLKSNQVLNSIGMKDRVIAKSMAQQMIYHDLHYGPGLITTDKFKEMHYIGMNESVMFREMHKALIKENTRIKVNNPEQVLHKEDMEAAINYACISLRKSMNNRPYETTRQIQIRSYDNHLHHNNSNYHEIVKHTITQVKQMRQDYQKEQKTYELEKTHHYTKSL